MGNELLSKITEIEWDIRLETSGQDYYYLATPICDVTVFFEDGKKGEFSIQIGDKPLIVDEGKDLDMSVINRIIDRIFKPLQKESDALMNQVENLTKYGEFRKEFLDQFWLDNITGK